MIPFRDPELAEGAKNRLQDLAGLELTGFWDVAFEHNPDPDRAIINLERWLSSTSNPGTYLSHLVETPKLARLLIDLLGASQSVADALIQNPELASVITDPSSISRPPAADEVLQEGRALLAATTSHAHKLDRLRFLKQRWRLPIIVNDLAGTWPAETVWRSISDLADAIITLTAEAVWDEYAKGRGLEYPCPIMVVAFGKLGGHELNYSSDIDLVYVLEDEPPEGMERHAGRFCEMLTRALGDQMGRGSLYRVDLRLRPFGGSGTMCPTMRAVETYYRSHAEIWEAQALLRSRPVCGSPQIWPRWQALLYQHCFRRGVSELTVQEILSTRERIEEHAADDDLKRGAGGIRDIEFLVQLLQMLHGYAHVTLRVKSTLDALKLLASEALLDARHAARLAESYTLLRQIEHRIQLVDDQQTHTLPKSPGAREHLARLSGVSTWSELSRLLDSARHDTRSIYGQIFSLTGVNTAEKDRALQLVSAETRLPLEAWIDSLPESGEFYRSLLENDDSLHRIEIILSSAPALLDDLKGQVPLAEMLFSGEIEEPQTVTLGKCNKDRLEEFARAARAARLRLVLHWLFAQDEDLGNALSDLYDHLLQCISTALEARYDVIALGSFGLAECALASDLDIVLLSPEEISQESAESDAQKLLGALDMLRRYGWPVAVDLRLRPEGGKGLLVRSHRGLKTYELEQMELWERFALGHARLVYGSQSSLEVVIKTAYAIPITPERLKDLVAMKHRIETERVKPQHWRRDVKLGFGGLSDIEWFIHLNEMRYTTTLEVGSFTTTRDRLKRMLQSGLINAVEYEQLGHAHKHLLLARNFISLLGFTPDVIPENPDKLEHLARAVGSGTANDFLRNHEQVIENVRAIYLAGLERLGA